MPRVRLVIPALVVVVAGVLLAVRGAGHGGRESVAPPIRVLPPDSEITGVLQASYRVGAYRIRLYADTSADEKVADILRDGHRVYAVRAPAVWFQYVGEDITGDLVPDLVVHQFSGGMHCCTQATVLGLGDSLLLYGTINGADGDVEFAEVDHDGIPEAIVGDYRFAYWRDYPFVETQVPEVILRFRDGRYEPACDLMRQPPPDSATLVERARELSDGWVSGEPPAELWGYAVDLVYQGHSELAWHFLDLAWPPMVSGKREFVRDLQARLRGSPCWSPPPSGRPTT